MFKRNILLLIGIVLVTISCNGNRDNYVNVLTKKEIQVYVTYSSECPNCKRVKADLVNTALKFNSIEFNLLPIDDTTIVSLPLFNIITSNSKKIAKKLKMTITPEVAVLKNGKILYLGAITDQNLKLTQGKPHATENYLVKALQCAISNSKPCQIENKTAVGCYIEY